MALIRKDRFLESAVGSTTYSDPVVKQAVQRLRSGQLSRKDFAALYSGPVRAAFLLAKVKHAPVHGFSKTLTPSRQVRTLQEF